MKHIHNSYTIKPQIKYIHSSHAIIKKTKKNKTNKQTNKQTIWLHVCRWNKKRYFIELQQKRPKLSLRFHDTNAIIQFIHMGCITEIKLLSIIPHLQCTSTGPGSIGFVCRTLYRNSMKSGMLGTPWSGQEMKWNCWNVFDSPV